MKKNIGTKLCLYPMPVAVIGSVIQNKINYALAAHFGIVSHHHILVSLAKNHYSNIGIRENKALTINFIDEDMLIAANQTGFVSRKEHDKSNMFTYRLGETGMPIIDEAPLTIECSVIDIYEIDGFDNFICEIKAVYVEDKYLTDNQIDYQKFKPVLFEFPTYQYLLTGKVLGKCISFKK